jgi:nucleotide-binding universal stress UspA family protein
MYDKVIVTLDGSELAEKALPHAEAIARALGVKLVLLHVVPYPLVDDAGVESELEKIDKKYLESLAQDLRAAGLPTDTNVLWANVPNKIVEYVEENCGALLVMATHGRTGLTKLVCGSVTEGVLREGKTTPVLVVRSVARADPKRSL